MLATPAEAPNVVDAPTVVDDPPSARFTWTIENFSRLNAKKMYSDVFFVGGYKWYAELMIIWFLMLTFVIFL